MKLSKPVNFFYKYQTGIMKYNVIFFVLLISFVVQTELFAQMSRGAVKESILVDSKIMGRKMHYTIYLPFDYYTSERLYPVVYLLHGYTDNETGWLQYGEVNMIADEAIASRQIPPMILVMPDGGVSWYINNFDNTMMYEDFFFKEFIPYIESTYRIRQEKHYRGIAGLSMGGFGSIVYSLRHPDMFAACAAFSPALRTDEETINLTEERWKATEGLLYGQGLKGKLRLTEVYKNYNPFYIIRNSSIDKIKQVRFYFDCGDDDHLYNGNSLFHILLRDTKIPHEYRVRNGGHDWTYWRDGLVAGLEFIAQSFH